MARQHQCLRGVDRAWPERPGRVAGVLVGTRPRCVARAIHANHAKHGRSTRGRRSPVGLRGPDWSGCRKGLRSPTRPTRRRAESALTADRTEVCSRRGYCSDRSTLIAAAHALHETPVCCSRKTCNPCSRMGVPKAGSCRISGFGGSERFPSAAGSSDVAGPATAVAREERRACRPLRFRLRRPWLARTPARCSCHSCQPCQAWGPRGRVTPMTRVATIGAARVRDHNTAR